MTNDYVLFDRVAQVYDKTRPIPKAIKKFYKKELMSYLEKEGRPPYEIIALGVGTGRIEKELVSKEVQLFGIDLSFEMLRNYEKKVNNQYSYIIQADGYTLPFRKKFDLCTLIHVTHLMNNFEKLLSEIKTISNYLVQGEAYTDLYNNPVRKAYVRRLEELGWEERKGSEEAFQEFVKDKGYKIKLKKKEVKTDILLSEVYQIIKNNYLSTHWTADKKMHNQAIHYVDENIASQDIDVEKKLKVPARIVLRFVDLQ